MNQKVKKLLDVLSPEVNFDAFDQEINQLKESLKQNITVKTLEDVNVQLEKFKRRINIDPLVNSVEGFKQMSQASSAKTDQLDYRTHQLNNLLQSKLLELHSLIAQGSESSTNSISELENNVNELKAKLAETDTANKSNLQSSLENVQSLQKSSIDKITKDLNSLSKSLKDNLATLINSGTENKQGLEKQSKIFQDNLASLKTELVTRIGNLGGGSMNRQIAVEGVVAIKKYTDINFYGVTSSVITSVDNVNKRINIGIQGGGGSGSTIALYVNSVLNGSQGVLNLKQGTNVTVSDNGTGTVTISASAGSVVAGITRIASVISVSSTLAAATLTDYVVFANVGINLTLPTAISNSNLYTVKNLAASSVLVSTTAGQTIDGSSTALLSAQYQSLDLISNNSVWGVV